MKLAVGSVKEGKLSQNMKWPAGDTDDGAVGPVQLNQISTAGRVMEAGEAGSWICTNLIILSIHGQLT